MVFFKLFLLNILVLTVYISPIDSHDRSWVTLIKMKNALDKGDSLKGKTVKGLQTGKYKVEASGAVLNFMKRPLHVQAVEAASGVINHPLPDVRSGIVEGFASRKSSDSATGTWVRYSLLSDNNMMVHFMYSAPYDFNLHKNWLSVAVCSRRSSSCRSLDARKMYYNKYGFLRRKVFSKDINPVGVCYIDRCLIGWMMSNHLPTMYLLLVPKSYYDLSEETRKRLPKMSVEDYAQVIKPFLV